MFPVERFGRGSVIALCVGLLACDATPAPLEWRIELEPAALRTRTVVVDARILRGGCDGEEVFGLELRRGASMRPVPPPLAAGTWGFAAAAHDASCVRFAYDCVEVQLPGDRLVVDRPVAVSEAQVCTPPRCQAGGCRLEDVDMDGFGRCSMGQDPATCDCAEGDAEVFPGALDPCDDGVDQDCDGDDDRCDADCDGYPTARPGDSGAYLDCDDTAVSVHPNEPLRGLYGEADGDRLARGCEAMPMTGAATDPCSPGPGGEPLGDEIDQDCNGFVDDGPGCADPTDRDRDGSRACAGGVTLGCDTNDCDPGISPEREELCGNEVDEDGDGMVAPCDPDDLDGDGQLPAAMGGDDCDDTNPTIFFGAPENCTTTESESCTENIACTAFGGDADGDGYVTGLPAGVRGDCDDTSAEIQPFAAEDPCDGRDNDCDGVIDEVLDLPTAGFPSGVEGCVRAGGSSTAVRFDTTAAATEYCGGCGITTDPNQNCCAGVLTDVDVPGACGDCGYDCGAHTTCSMLGTDAGGNTYGCACAPDGSGEWADCDGSLTAGSGGDGCEADLNTDERNCGMCGRRCGTNETCTDGTCGCSAPYLDCDERADNGCEVNGSNDANNCRTCGTRCRYANASGACSGSSCRLATCDGGYGDCNDDTSDGCEVALSGLGNCGSCGEACASVVHSTEICSAARACDYSSCDPGWADCNTRRSDGCERTLTSTSDCGACGNTCGASEACSAGGQCTCGAVSGMPGAGEACSGAGAECCGTSCIDVRTSASHCGMCSRTCSTAVLNVATRVCSGGACDYSGACSTGFGDCDGTRGNGCEQALTAVPNCGSCGNACLGVLNVAARTCSASRTCDYSSCAAGFADCDGSRTNGCEANLRSTTSCGACGVRCGFAENCNASGDCQCGTSGTSSPSGPACVLPNECDPPTGTCSLI